MISRSGSLDNRISRLPGPVHLLLREKCAPDQLIGEALDLIGGVGDLARRLPFEKAVDWKSLTG